jgi:hypothetical protein
VWGGWWALGGRGQAPPAPAAPRRPGLRPPLVLIIRRRAAAAAACCYLKVRIQRPDGAAAEGPGRACIGRRRSPLWRAGVQAEPTPRAPRTVCLCLVPAPVLGPGAHLCTSRSSVPLLPRPDFRALGGHGGAAAARPAPAATAASVGRYQRARGRGRGQHSGLPGAVFGWHAMMS